LGRVAEHLTGLVAKMARCGCASSSCACLLEGGNGITITGNGNSGSPYVAEIDCDAVEACIGGGGGGEALLSPRYAQGAVVFTWDDGWDTHPSVADMHAARGQKATFYVTTNLLGTAQHMTAGAIAPMVAQGHEIGAHSADHLDMTTLTPVTRAPQWASQQTLEGIIGGGYQVRSYAYPFGTHNLATDQESYGRFDRIASVGLSQGFAGSSTSAGQWMYEPGKIENYRHGRFPWSQTTHAQFMRILKDYVLKRPVILTAYAHQIGNPDTPTLIQVTEAMDYCQANGIPCLTSAQAFPGPKVVNAGFENSIDGWVVITAGTGATGLTVDSFTDAPSAGLPGTKSLRVISPNTPTTNDTVEVMQTFPVDGDRPYTFSGRIRHDPTPVGVGAGVKLRINEMAADGTVISGRAVSGAASTTAWTQGTVTPAALNDGRTIAGRSHPEARYWEVGVRINNVTGTFYADHLYFGPTEAAGAIG
jgi:peptidoglycan/xylan/chitin deacetylase (PgdA/CDA1 family)